MFRNRDVPNGFDLKHLVAVDGYEPGRVLGNREALRPGEPGDWLVAIDVVDEYGVVWLHDCEDVTADATFPDAIGSDETVAGDNARRHGLGWLVLVFE